MNKRTWKMHGDENSHCSQQPPATKLDKLLQIHRPISMWVVRSFNNFHHFGGFSFFAVHFSSFLSSFACCFMCHMIAHNIVTHFYTPIVVLSLLLFLLHFYCHCRTMQFTNAWLFNWPISFCSTNLLMQLALVCVNACAIVFRNENIYRVGWRSCGFSFSLCGMRKLQSVPRRVCRLIWRWRDKRRWQQTQHEFTVWFASRKKACARALFGLDFVVSRRRDAVKNQMRNVADK